MTTIATDAPPGLISGLVWLGLLHSVWIGLLAAAVVACIFQARWTLPHQMRHAILLAALAVVAIGPATLAGLQLLVPAGAAGSPPIVGATVVVVTEESGTKPGPAPSDAPGIRSERSLSAIRSSLARVVAVARAARPFGLAAWSLAFSAGMAVLALGAMGLGRLGRAAAPAPPEMRARTRRFGRCLRLGRIPEVRVHPTLDEPCLCGVFRPVILLPGRWLASAGPETLDAVLAHELAHARRLDLPVNGLQRMLEIALFFHPGVLWLSRSLRRQRELCADALAVRLTGDPLSLARALESVARLRLAARSHRPIGATLGGDDASLLPRIQELLGMTPTRPTPRSWPFAALPSASILALVAVSIGFAQDGPSPPRDEVRPPAEEPQASRPATGTAAPPPRRGGVRPGVGPEPPMISFEVRFLDIEPDTWRDGLEGRLRALGPQANVSRWIVDGPTCDELVKRVLAGPAAKMILAPKVTAFEGDHAIIAIGPDRAKDDEGRPAGPDVRGSSRVDLSGSRLTQGTRIAVDVNDSPPRVGPAGPATSVATHKGSYDQPEGSSLALGLGRRQRVLEARTVVSERLVVITPRRILPESEEVRVDRR